MNEQTQYRIGNAVSVALISLAAFADLIGLIPIVEDYAGSIFWIIVNLYFLKKKIGIFDAKKLATMGVSWLAGMIPIIQALPQITIGIIAVLMIIRTEDKTGISLGKAGVKNITKPKIDRTPLNNGGVRLPNK